MSFPSPHQRVGIAMSTSDFQRAGSASGIRPTDLESDLIAALRRGEERAFETLILRHHTSLVRLARVWVRDAPAAEEVAQETWLAVVQGIHSFQGRSPLQSWIFGILANKAKRRGVRESRSHPFSDYAVHADQEDIPDISPDNFFPHDHAGAGHWTYPLADVESCPERHMLAEEAGGFILAQIDELPANFRSVILLRDVHGFTVDETCALLGISPTNQRVMLHRARTRLRFALEPYLREGNDCVKQHG